MANIVLEYETVINAIGNQLQSVWSDLMTSGVSEVVETLSAIKNIEVSNEQHFVEASESEKLKSGTLYVVVKFGSGPINYGSTVSPISLTCVGTANKVRPVQLLLGVFASTWTTKALNQGLDNEVSSTVQVWSTPEVISNFNIFGNNFRNLYKLSGNILFGPSAVRVGELTYYWGDGEGEHETVNIMSFQDGFSSSLDSQPFGDTKGFAKSEANFSTYTFTISTYLLDNQLSADVLALRGFRNRRVVTDENDNSFIAGYKSMKGQNDEFKIKLTFTNGFDNMPSSADDLFDANDPAKGSDFYMYYKVVNSGIGQEIAGIPSLTISFTR